MITVTINLDHEIFDDPEFCADCSIGFCEQLYRDGIWTMCHQFPKYKLTINNNEYRSDIPIKCQQCKDEYNKKPKNPELLEV